MQAEAIEAEALRRSDELKTSLLRSVSHDLRTPLTSIIAAGAALDSPSATAEERHELSDAVVEQGQRLSRLVENLLDVSRLRDRATPSRTASRSTCRRLLEAARDSIGTRGEAVRLALDADLPALAPTRPSSSAPSPTCSRTPSSTASGEPVLVRSRQVGPRLVVRVVDRGPGIPEQRARADLRAVLPARGRSRARFRPRPGDRPRLHRGQRRRGRGRVAARPGQSSFVVSFACPGEGHERPAAHPRLRRRAADPAGAEGDPARRRLRGGHRRHRRGGSRPGRRQTTRGGDPRPDAARPRRGRGDAAAARVEPDADPRPLRGRRGGPQGRGAGRRRRRLRDQAVRPARARRPPRGGAAPGGAGRTPSRRSSPTGSRSTSPPARSGATASRST